MRVLMFKERFAGDVLAGVKRQTIRLHANCQKGDLLSLRKWEGKPYRSPHELLCDGRCTGVERVLIDECGIAINERRLQEEEADAFAAADGFKSEDEMMAFFEAEYGLPVRAAVIYWDPEEEVKPRASGGETATETTRGDMRDKLPNKCTVDCSGEIAFKCTAANEAECGFACGAVGNGTCCYWNVQGECTEHRAIVDAAREMLKQWKAERQKLVNEVLPLLNESEYSEAMKEFRRHFGLVNRWVCSKCGRVDAGMDAAGCKACGCRKVDAKVVQVNPTTESEGKA